MDLLDQIELRADADWSAWLGQLGVIDVRRGNANLISILTSGMTRDLQVNLLKQLGNHLPETSDPGDVLNNLERFVQASRSPQSLAALFERDPESLPILLRIFSISQYLADVLIRDPETFDLLRLTEGQSVSREILVDELCSEVSVLRDEQQVMRSLRAFKHREILRIAYGDFIGQMSLEVVTQQISYLAEAICEAAIKAAWRFQVEKRGLPLNGDGQPARFAAIAMGKLGGMELNYSSDIDLFFLAEVDGQTDGPRSIGNQEFFNQLATMVVRFLSESTSLGMPYRVDLRLRPYGTQGALVTSPSQALQYFDSAGRTWERQAFVKARPVAGDTSFAAEFLGHLSPWIYRRYLSRADISGIRQLKRRMEKRSQDEGSDFRNVKTGHGGIRDIEYAIQFLQLLNGGDLDQIRSGNTVTAIAQLESAGCLTHQERTILDESYRFLRRIEHCLQIMYDLQTHTIPVDPTELRRLALRAGFRDTAQGTAVERFEQLFAERTTLNRKILNHLLHDAFGNESEMPEETDLILDPEPSSEFIQSVLAKYRFRNHDLAYRMLLELSVEKVSFLSTRRCRHFLAAIAPKLLSQIASTPDPDQTLIHLSRVSDSIGGKATLWELFSLNPPSMDLYVRLCACSPYLVGILTSNPGMVDELLDSLLLDRLPTYDELETQLAELCQSAEDIDPILQSFKNSQHLRVGMRDILGKDEIEQTLAALSDIAEVTVKQVVDREYHNLLRRYGVPTIAEGDRVGQPSDFVVIALGKLGGREPNYHSDLDLLFLFDGEGTTKSLVPTRRHDGTTNRHFFNLLGQRVIQVINRVGPYGKLYDLDVRLRPNGRSGPLVISIDEFEEYFASGRGQTWEVQALCKARPIWGESSAREKVALLIKRLVLSHGQDERLNDAIRDMRMQLETSASPQNIKRGVGGTVDVEFLVQLLQMKFGESQPSILTQGTFEALRALAREGILSQADADELLAGYRGLRGIESGLRLMNTTARHDLPQSDSELEMLMFLLRWDKPTSIADASSSERQRIRSIFDRVIGR